MVFINCVEVAAGISNVSDPCCEVPINGPEVNGSVCDNRNNCAFFDAQHNTEAFDAILASKIFNSSDPTELILSHQSSTTFLRSPLKSI